MTDGSARRPGRREKFDDCASSAGLLAHLAHEAAIERFGGQERLLLHPHTSETHGVAVDAHHQRGPGQDVQRFGDDNLRRQGAGGTLGTDPFCGVRG